jgi:hypothetical protein
MYRGLGQIAPATAPMFQQWASQQAQCGDFPSLECLQRTSTNQARGLPVTYSLSNLDVTRVIGGAFMFAPWLWYVAGGLVLVLILSQRSR